VCDIEMVSLMTCRCSSIYPIADFFNGKHCQCCNAPIAVRRTGDDPAFDTWWDEQPEHERVSIFVFGESSRPFDRPQECIETTREIYNQYRAGGITISEVRESS